MYSNWALRSGVPTPRASCGWPAGCSPPRAAARPRSRADTVALPRQFLGQPPRTLAGPPQRRLGIASRHGSTNASRAGGNPGSVRRHGCRPRPVGARVGICGALDRQIQFPHPARDRQPRQPAGASDQRHASPAQFPRFGCGPLPTPPLVHLGEPTYDTFGGSVRLSARPACRCHRRSREDIPRSILRLLFFRPLMLCFLWICHRWITAF